jgi:integrase
MPTQNRVTLTDLWKDYYDWAEKTQKDHSNKKRRWMKWIKPNLGSVPLSKLSTKAVEQFQLQMLDMGLKPATANRVTALLKHLIKRGVDWDLVPPEALVRVRRVKQLREPPGRVRFLKDDEIETLLKCCDDKLRPIVTTAVFTGLRKGELMRLRWEDVDLAAGMLVVRNSKSGKSRTVPITEPVKSTLEALPRFLGSPWVFWTEPAGQARKNIRRAWDKAIKESGITDFRFHDLRHTAGSKMANAGVDLYVIMSVLGHSSFKMVERYAHLDPGHLRRELQKINPTDGHQNVTTEEDVG